MTAVVNDEQLSLAIGKGGINAELASQLTGLGVDIISQEEYIRREAEKTKEAGILLDLGLNEKIVFTLNSHGIKTIRDLSAAEAEFLVELPGIGPKTAEKLITMAKEYLSERSKKNVEKEKADPGTLENTEEAGEDE